MEEIKFIDKTSLVHTESAPNRKIEFIVIHYTAEPSSLKGSAVGIAEYFAATEREASSDFIVDDEDFVVYNKDIYNIKCWHCGGAKYDTLGGKYFGVCSNRNSVGIEVCSNNPAGHYTYPNDPAYYFTEKTVNNALKLTKYLMKLLDIDADHVIRHYDVNGKICPGIIGWNIESGDESKWIEFKSKLTEN